MNEADILATVLACFCENLASTSAGAPADCCIISSGRPVVPDCCAGFAWVRPITAYPSTAFPAPDQVGSRCRPPTWAMVVELGVQRCAPALCGPLDASCCDSEESATADLLSDFSAMRRTLVCCLPAASGLKLDEIVIGPWAPLDPEGGCGGSTITATLRWVDSCTC